MLPEERAREKIDRQLKKAGWDIVSREEYIPHSASAVKEALMQGNTESDYLIFVDDKAIAVVEAKREENPLAEDVQSQAEGYATHPQDWYCLWYDGLIPLVYLFRYGSMRDILWNVTGNAAMFVPSGILLPLVYRRCRSFLKTAAAGALLSLCIEILQLPFPARASDVDDLILNTLGAAAGYGIYAAFRHLKRKPDRVE